MGEIIGVHIAVLAIAEDPARTDLTMVNAVVDRANAAGHRIIARANVQDSEAVIREQLETWIARSDIDVVIATGGIDSAEAPGALKPLITQTLPGFSDLFRFLAYQDVGTGAMLSNAEAAQCGSTLVFLLPASLGAVEAAMEKLLIPQLDHRTQPRNLVMLMPRLRQAVGAASAVPRAPKVAPVAAAIPEPIVAEKTATGIGLGNKLPAMPSGRAKATTANVIARKEREQTVDDPPTKPIELASLERQIALSGSSANDAPTRRIDLSGLLPPLPPGADELLEVDDEPEILASPPVQPTARGAQSGSVAPGRPPPVRPITRPPPSTIFEPAPRRARSASTPPAPPPRPRPASTPPVVRTRPATDAPPMPARPRPASTPPAVVPVRTRPATDAPPMPVRTRPATGAPPVVPVRTRPATGAPPMQTRPRPASTPPAPLMPVRTRPATGAPPLRARPASGVVPVISAADPRSAAPLHLAAELPSRLSDPEIVTTEFVRADEEPASTSEAEPRAIAPPPPVRPVVSVPLPNPRPAAVGPRFTADAAEVTAGAMVPTPRRSRRRVVLVLIAVALGLGATAGAVMVFTSKQDPAPTSASSSPGDATLDAPPLVVAELAPAVAPTVPPVVEPAVEPVVESAVAPPITPTVRPVAPIKVARPASVKPDRPAVTPVAKPAPVTTVEEPAGSADPAPIPEPTPPAPADSSECGEVACVMEHYARKCCERYKPADADFKPTTGLPEQLDRTMARAGLEKVKPRVIACGEKSGVKGTVKLAIAVGGDGNVRSVSVAETPDAALGECVAAAVRKATFGKTVNGATFTYPLVF